MMTGCMVKFEANHLTSITMSPITSLFTNSSDPLGLELQDEHRQRYEQVRAWREQQRDPYFTEVPTQWREEFAKKEKAVRRKES